MKVKYFLMMLASAFLLSNCSQDEEATQAIQGKTNKLIATIEGASRSAVTDSGIFSWTEGDAISVWNGTDFTTFTLSDGNVFTAQESINPSGVAIYPANVAHTYENQTVGVELATEYAYGSTNAPLLAQVSGSNLTFKHLGGLMRFVVKDVPANATSFKFTANSRITGNFAVSDNSENESIISTDNETGNTVTVTFASANITNPMVFYVPLPVGEYSGYKVEIAGKSHTTAETVKNTIKRGSLLLMPTFIYSDAEGLVKGTNDVIVLESSEQSLSVSGDKSLVIEAEDDVQAVLNLNYTPTDNAELTLSESSEATGSQEQSLATINVAVPNASTVSTLDINLPSMTVELTAKDGESATYSQVTTLTAQNTLKIGKGVNVGKLIVKGGHIRLGGTITGEISRDSANGDAVTYIILEEGSEAPANLPANVKAVNAAEYDLIKAAANGGTVKLQNDLSITDVISVSGNLVIDLNGFNLDASSNQSRPFEVTNGGSLTINGGTSSIKIGKYGLVNVPAGNDATIVLNGGIYSGETDFGSFLKPRGEGEISITLDGVKHTDSSTDGFIMDASSYEGDNLSTTISNCDFKAAGGLIGTVGEIFIEESSFECSGTGYQFAAIEFSGEGTGSIKNSTITSAGIAVSTGYNATTTVENCEVSGVEYAYCVYQSGGVINVTGGNYTGPVDIYPGNLYDVAEIAKITINNEIVAQKFKNQVNSADALKTAITAGGTINLGANIAISEVLSISKEVIINLNGFNLDASSNQSRPFEVTNGGSLTINGGTSSIKIGKYGLVNVPAGNDATIVLNGGIYSGETDFGSFLKPRGEGEISITLDGVKHTDSSTDGFIMDASSYEGDNLSTTISNCDFKAAGGLIGTVGEIFIEESSFECSGTGYQFAAIEFSGEGTGSIKNSTITSAGIAVSTGYNATTTVENCEVSGVEYAYCVYQSGGVINVTGGNYTGPVDIYPGNLYDVAEIAKITINNEIVAQKSKQ